MERRMDQEWRQLLNNPADCNEHNKLELSRAWEPLSSSGPLSLGKVKEAPFGFSYGNQK